MTDTAEETVIRELCAEMHRIRARVPTSRWYMFGSVTKAQRPIGDIDVLVICETTAGCNIVRAELALICSSYPIHLLLMTTSEEADVNFIKEEGALEIGTRESALPLLQRGRSCQKDG